MEKLLTKFLTTRLGHEVIAPEYKEYEWLKENSREAKFETLFDAYDKHYPIFETSIQVEKKESIPFYTFLRKIYLNYFSLNK